MWGKADGMNLALRCGRRALTITFVAVLATLVGFNQAEAQPDPGTGAQAFKNCPADVAIIGTTITCSFIVSNSGDFPAVVTALTETSPYPGGTAVAISCTLVGGAVINVGGTLAPNTPCGGTFELIIPNDRTLCGTGLVDRVDIALSYSQFEVPLIAGAFATETTRIACPPETTTTTTTTPATTAPPTTTADVAPTPGVFAAPTTAPAVPAPVVLPATGGTSGVTIAAAVAMIALGAIALLFSRRRIS
jgi:LPXTG-motif cell wall-anchored protein